MSKATETAKKTTGKKEKAVAENTAAPEETVTAETASPEAQTPEAPAPEQEAPQDEASEAELRIEDLFERVSSLFDGKVPAGFRLAPEGFACDFDGDDEFTEGETGCCGAAPTLEDAYEAGVQAGTRRASHPVFGIGIAAPVVPVPAKPQVALTPINVVDDTTAAFAHLVDLKKLHEVGILTDDEFNAKKADILRHVY